MYELSELSKVTADELNFFFANFYFRIRGNRARFALVISLLSSNDFYEGLIARLHHCLAFCAVKLARAENWFNHYKRLTRGWLCSPFRRWSRCLPSCSSPARTDTNELERKPGIELGTSAAWFLIRIHMSEVQKLSDGDILQCFNASYKCELH